MVMNSTLLRALSRDAQDVVSNNSGLSIIWKQKVPVKLIGNYKVLDNFGKIQGDFDIEVVIPSNYPFEFPILREVGGKIPPSLDRHILPGGIACVENSRKVAILKIKGISLHNFFCTYVHRFFCWQLVYEEDNGAKKLTEWSHGEQGIREFYVDRFQTTDGLFIKGVLGRMIYNSLPGRNDPCFCSSGAKFKNCHGGIIGELSLIPRSDLISDLKLWE